MYSLSLAVMCLYCVMKGFGTSFFKGFAAFMCLEITVLLTSILNLFPQVPLF